MFDAPAYMRQRARERREFVRAYKVHKGCVDCGYNEHHSVLELDHPTTPRSRPQKYGSFNPGWSWERLLTELDMLEVRCVPCHRRITAERRRSS